MNLWTGSETQSSKGKPTTNFAVALTEKQTVILSAAKDLRSFNSEFNYTGSFANAQDDSVGKNEEIASQTQLTKASFDVIAGKTFLLTINPFGSFKMVENAASACFIFLICIQAILNTTLLFLLGLGIRNRFKLK